MVVTTTAVTTGAVAGTALLGGRVVADVGASLTSAAPDVSALARAAAGMAIEAIGGPPARRAAANGQRYWIEVRGLEGDDGPEILTNVLAAVSSTPGVQDAFVNRAVARVVVAVDADGPTMAELCRVVADAEPRSAGGAGSRTASLPGDDAVLAGRMLAAAAALAGVGLSVTGSVVPLRGLPDLFAVPITLTDQTPRLRRHLEQRLGPEATDLLFGVVNAATASATLSPTAAAAEAVTRLMLAAEALSGRSAWRRHEADLAQRLADDDTRLPSDMVPPVDGPGERYADRAGLAGVGAAAVLGLLSRDAGLAGAAALAAAPKPLRGAREGFGCAVTRGLIAGHDAVVLRPRALRMLDRIDVVMIDPRAVYADELTVSRVLGVSNSRRGHAWEAVRAALNRKRLSPGWHDLADIPGAGDTGTALVSPVRDPFAGALVAEARRAHRRVVSLDDDGLRSLAQGFDELRPLAGSVDESVAAAVDALKAQGATVLLLTTADMRAAHRADVTVGVVRTQRPPPWGADVFVPDLLAAWRLLHALPAARSATDRGIHLSVSASAIGALMLIPGVVGRGPESVNAGVVAGLWTGYSAAAKVFRDPVPEPEASHEWHALPVEEVQRLLPRPPDDHRDEPSRGWTDRVPMRGLGGAAASAWDLGREFAGEMRTNLSDPLTPLLATGAVASALLGSALDAALVGGVLLANAALSAEQQLHAERILRRLLAVEDPLARRRVGPLDDARQQKVAAKLLRVGDIIEVHADEVVPADARVIAADNVEVDESTLTGESLPVPKYTEPTPGAPLAERGCMLYAGTTLVAGTALAVVVAVGSRTEVRRALAMAPAKSREIGLQRQLSRITQRAMPFSLGGGALVGLLSVFRGTPLREAVGSAVAMTVAAVPEGLPLVATLAQLASARRLTGESVLIRNPHSVEALARLQVVCFDKTGTLSENQLEIKSVRPVGGFTEADVLDAAATTIFVRPGHRAHHATDDAIRRAIDGSDDTTDSISPPRDAFLPFQSGRPFAAALVGTRLTIKGAPEVLASALRNDRVPRMQMIAEMAAAGLRVLAVAERHLTAEQAAKAAADPVVLESFCTSDLLPVGLLGLADTPRAAAPRLLAALAERGIGVRLITGDHPVTASVIANELGVAVIAEEVITGSQWETLSADERAEAVMSRRVFARMTPEHKIDIVQTLERVGCVTAMVGDGANDAAAIRAASVGIGVAARGSDPARTAADVVLLDGRIEALIDALDEGQQLWRRVQSAVSMLLGGNTGEVCFALITSLLTGRSVLNARQMLLVNMLTDALPAAALAVSPQNSSAHVDRDEAAMWRAIGIRGASTTVAATLAWSMASVTGTQRRASTVALIGLVGAQLAQTLADSHGRLVVLTTFGSFGVLVAIVSTPGVSQVFGCTPVDPLGWGQALVATGVAAAISALAPDVLYRVSEALRRGLDDRSARDG
ncbi:P-type ATPase, translocating [Mycolicibacterium chubuense NBB4]|uniref:P-type ATPase, translocating n=1 Tax=Mycolicibacterium chubuense (strain NBB4) TaxID=710421 RepID=I4BIB7_MYCCN|nr:cation-translocating P-type ATPase [Mycolicibacterium chubuense]AFM17024.1 P-type ATPase, translocating [Mycolicibacterium chubuense NBB4]